MMDSKIFNQEISRLIDRFGERNFGGEFVKLIASEVQDMEPRWFRFLVTKMISELPVNRPPLLKDFRIPAYHERQAKFSKQASAVAKEWGKSEGLTKYLESIGAGSLSDALKKEKKKVI